MVLRSVGSTLRVAVVFAVLLVLAGEQVMLPSDRELTEIESEWDEDFEKNEKKVDYFNDHSYDTFEQSVHIAQHRFPHGIDNVLKGFSTELINPPDLL